MKMLLKVLVWILVLVVISIFIDTLQAKVFNNSPFIKITKNENGLIVDKGVLVNTYIVDGEKTTLFIWEEFSKENSKNNAGSPYSDDQLETMALDYFMKNGSDLLSRDNYTVGISEDVPDLYQDEGLVVIEIRHVNNGNNTLDARYYINIYTGKGFDDLNNDIILAK